MAQDEVFKPNEIMDVFLYRIVMINAIISINYSVVIVEIKRDEMFFCVFGWPNKNCPVVPCKFTVKPQYCHLWDTIFRDPLHGRYHPLFQNIEISGGHILAGIPVNTKHLYNILYNVGPTSKTLG